PGAHSTRAPAATEGRGPKLQKASRSLAIASAQFLLISAAVVVLFWVLGKLWSILLPCGQGPADGHGGGAGHPLPPQAPVAAGAGRLGGPPGRGRDLRRDHRRDRPV